MAYRGPETGTRDRASYLLQQNKIRLVLTTPMTPGPSPSPLTCNRHGDGVRDIALWVDDARDAFAKAVERGAEPAQEPTVLSDEDGEVVIAAIETYGDTIHSPRRAPRTTRACSCPASSRCRSRFKPEPVGLQYVDHCVGNVELGKMNELGEVLRAT